MLFSNDINYLLLLLLLLVLLFVTYSIKVNRDLKADLKFYTFLCSQYRESCLKFFKERMLNPNNLNRILIDDLEEAQKEINDLKQTIEIYKQIDIRKNKEANELKEKNNQLIERLDCCETSMSETLLDSEAKELKIKNLTNLIDSYNDYERSLKE